MLPLKGIRVIDVSPLVPSSLSSMLLGDFGADVIKLELPGAASDARQIWGYPDIRGMSSIFAAFNRNKRSLTVDLRKARGREIFLKLCSGTDVVIEGFRCGVAEQLGIGYRAIKEINHEIIYCSLSGYGPTSPYRDKPGHDLDFAALSGVLSLTGNTEGAPSLPGYLIADFSGSMMATVAILIALFQRQKEGGSRHIDVSLLDSVISLMGFTFLTGVAAGAFPRGNDLLFNGKAACYNHYQAKDGRYLVVTAMEPKYWRALCLALNREDLVDLQLDQGSQSYLKNELSGIFGEKTAGEWMDSLSGKDVCVSPVLTLEEVIHGEHAGRRGLFREIDEEGGGGPFPQVDNPIHFAGEVKESMRRRPPSKGEHTDELLRALGYTKEDLLDLRKSSVI